MYFFLTKGRRRDRLPGAGAIMRHARGSMHSSWSGGASLAALVLVCVKTALFTHYGLLSLARGSAPMELEGVVMGDGKGRPGGGGGAGATSFLSWVEKGFEDIGGNLYSLGPNGGADSARRSARERKRGRLPAEASAASADVAIVTGASVVQLKHSVHREMMLPAPSAKARTMPANRLGGGSSGKAYTPPANRHGESLEASEAAVGKAAARVVAVPDDECGQSGFTCAELHAAEKAEKATEAKLPALPLPHVNGILYFI
jgi:hypothetical protein